MIHNKYPTSLYKNDETVDIVNISWSAGDLATNITYNVTVDIYAHNVTTNTTYVIWDDFTVFNSSSFNYSSGSWDIPSATLPTGCYFVSVSVFDNNDGMHLANDGFELGIGMDCSNTGGNGSGNGPMESLFAWTDLARVIRGRFLAMKDEDFVTAARLNGAKETG